MKPKLDWKPYIIDSQTNPFGEEFEAYNRRRWGGSGWTQHLKHEGRVDGATFKNWIWWPNTSKAHQLVQYAVSHGCDSDVCNQVLFHSLYEEGNNISLVKELVKIGKEHLKIQNIQDLQEYLEQDKGMEQVQRDIRRGQRTYNISGVPCFIIQKEGYQDVQLSGAQSSQTFVKIFKELSEH